MNDWIRQVHDAYHGIFGVPNYLAYLAHMAERHPGETVMPQDEFARCWIDRRYGAYKPRCC